MGKRGNLAALLLALALLTGGCAQVGPEPPAEPAADQSVPAGPAEPELSEEQIALQQEAGEKLNRFRWPRETVQKDILGREMEFVLYHGSGWTIHVPASWESEGVYAGLWSSPSHNAGFEVNKQFLGVNNPKHYRAQQGSWRHETDYDPPFDYYYDNDGGYTPPEGSADYLYFFAPDGDDQSYEFTLSSVVGEITEEEGPSRRPCFLASAWMTAPTSCTRRSTYPARPSGRPPWQGSRRRRSPSNSSGPRTGRPMSWKEREVLTISPAPWRWRITSRGSLSEPFPGSGRRGFR